MVIRGYRFSRSGIRVVHGTDLGRKKSGEDNASYGDYGVILGDGNSYISSMILVRFGALGEYKLQV